MLQEHLSEYQTVKGSLEVEEDALSMAKTYFNYSKKGKKTKLHFGYYITRKTGVSNHHYCVLAVEKISFVQVR
jgi:hypothetical protein